MIDGFEDITQELTWEEREMLPLIIKGLKSHKGADNPVTSKQIIAGMKKHGYVLSGARVRKIIHHIRVNRKVNCLLANGKGYWVSEDPTEIQTYLKSLSQRERSIKAVRSALNQDLTDQTTQGTLFNQTSSHANI